MKEYLPLSQPGIHSNDLFEFAKILGQQTDFQELLRLVANKSAQFLKADLALVLMLNPDTRETVITIIKEGKLLEQKEYRNVHIHVGGWIVSKGRSFISNDIQTDDHFSKGLFEQVPFKSIVGVPLVSEGIIVGALILLYKLPSNSVSDNTVKSLENIAAITTPFLRNVQKIRQYFNTSIAESDLSLKYKNAGLYGKNHKFIELLHSIEAATKCNARILLIGKTGTGKELIARAIHKFSSRAAGPFIAVDCGAIQTNLLESELFGHKRGAFTGADSDRQGLFLAANGGTLFMDEINNLQLEMQAKLLRALEEGEIRSVGSDKPHKIDVRIITASSVSLKSLVEENKFREDLFYRLYVYPIYVPDLNERQEDIPILANHFLQKFSKQQKKSARHFHDEVISFIKHRTWEGNVRELENFVERLVTLVEKDISTIDANKFPADLYEELKKFREKWKHIRTPESLKDQVDSFEAKLIKQTLEECDWNQSEAARHLRTQEKNIRYKMKILNIRKPGIN
ncbi:MAG: sigma 54-interacting transcriptional regulator [Ignavibacteriaceae bacterium]